MHETRLFEKVLNLLLIPFVIVGVVLSYIGKLLLGVARGVHGLTVKFLSTVVFLAILGYIISLVAPH